MNPTYDIISLPLDAACPSVSQREFDVKLVTKLQFPDGVGYGAGALEQVLSAHPLLQGNERIFAYLWEFTDWRGNGNQIDPERATRVELRYDGALSQSEILGNLLRYLNAGEEQRAGRKPRHDPYFDQLPSNHFVAVAETLDAVKGLIKSQQNAALASILATDPEVATTFERYSVELSRWVNSAAMMFVLHLLRHPRDDSLIRKAAAAGLSGVSIAGIDQLRAEVDKVAARLDATKSANACSAPDDELQSMVENVTTAVDVKDLNVAVHAAHTNPLLASRTGFVTAWRAVSVLPVRGSVDYILQIDRASLTFPSAFVDVGALEPTVFRRSTHTHPTSFGDLGAPNTGHSGLAMLNDSALRPRFRATATNSEHEIAKLVILQSRNSLRGASAEPKVTAPRPRFFTEALDDRPPEALASEQFGVPEPETSGVIFSAPLEDLVKPQALRFATPELRAAALPCFFLEDLRIGYRLDIRHSEGDRPTFASVHLQTQNVLLKASGAVVSGTTEDYFLGEQPDDPKFLHSSNEVALYRGMNTAQVRDYLKVLGKERPEYEPPDRPFSVSITGYCGATRLLFGHDYEYRLRHVFAGAVSLEEAAVNERGAQLGAVYHQVFPFYRAKAFRPGELVSFDIPDESDEDDPGQKTIYLSEKRRKKSIYLVPTPLDVDGARFHGLIFVDDNEPERFRRRRFVSDLGKHFIRQSGKKIDYFPDPEVHRILIRAKVLNGDPQIAPTEYVYVEGRYCQILKHAMVESVEQNYGRKREWESFAPIQLNFRTTSRSRVGVRSRGWFGQYYRIDYTVPESVTIELSILPVLEPANLKLTAWKVGSSSELQTSANREHLNVSLSVPDVAEQRITVVHLSPKPRRAPAIVWEPTRLHTPPSPPSDIATHVGTARRAIDSEFADVIGRVEVDAASTAEVRFEAVWEDINDATQQAAYVLNPGASASKPRSVTFRKYAPERPSYPRFAELFLQPGALSALKDWKVAGSTFGFFDQFSLQCAEDKLFYGVAPNDSHMKVDETGRLNVRDQRRKILTLRAIAVARGFEHFPELSVEERSAFSDPVPVDVPSSHFLTPPKIRYVMPLVRRVSDTGQNGRSDIRRLYGIRVYVDRPWFESGPGERLAIGCSTSEDIANATTSEVSKYFTQWGEDPLERPHINSTRRAPRAADFGTLSEYAERPLDENLYPAGVTGGRSAVTYSDNLRVFGEARVVKHSERFVSCASYAMRYDDHQRLWYADIVTTTEFFGWCGFALYRHQPHALPGRELSERPDWVYAALLYDEPVAWVQRGGQLHITVGPVYDPNVSYEFDSLAFNSNVSKNLSRLEEQRHRIQLKSYTVGGVRYFEGVVDKKRFEWKLLKKRFGAPVATRSLST